MELKETTIDLFRNDMKFSVAHFTIFSSTLRERIHGHNYYLRVRLRASVGELGLAFDYRDIRKILIGKCKFLNESFLLPTKSKFLLVEESLSKDSIKVTFNKKTMSLLKEDVTLLPLSNISSEALSSWFLSELLKNDEMIKENEISMIETMISTTQGHSSSAVWRKTL